MNILQYFLYDKISHNEKTKVLVKEVFRKCIHIMSAFVPLFARITSSNIAIITLSVLIILYSIFEMFRLTGKRFYFISSIVEMANRERDENRFSLGPVTLSLGIIIVLYYFPLEIASIAIFSLSFGDGFASLVGKVYGKKKFIFEGKTIAGTLACFIATFIAQILFTRNLTFSLEIAFITCLIEALPLKDFDNVLIPVIVGISANFLLIYNIFFKNLF